MSRVISNATSLIYLAKADRLGLVHSLFEEILIPEAVYTGCIPCLYSRISAAES